MFITLEGIEGAGKSTHGEFITRALLDHGHKVCFTREPGGTRAGEAIREILLHTRDMHIGDITELTLIFAARAQHLQEVIRPALERNSVVVCDRFTDATYAYQGGGRGIPQAQIRVLEQLIQQGLTPDLTLLFDVEVPVGLARAQHRSDADRFEAETSAFFERVRNAYLEIARSMPQRVTVIDANRDPGLIQADIMSRLRETKLC
jgi:dTMP kinase